MLGKGTFAVVGLLLTCSVVAHSETKGSVYYEDRASGSFSSSVIDTNGDGLVGVVGTLEGRSSMGRVSIHYYTEFDLVAAGPSERCPSEFLELPLVASRSVYRYRNNALMYLETVSETFCGNLQTGEFEWTETLKIIGGTGRFETASGELTITGQGTSLISGFEGTTNFGGNTLRTRGWVNFNNSGE